MANKTKQFRLKLKSDGQYRNAKGTLVFRYIVGGKDDALEAYEDAQGEFFRENDDDLPLYMTSRAVMKGSDLIVTSEGKIYVDNSALEEQASLVAQLGGNLGESLAREIASKMAGGKNTSASVKATSEEEEEETEESENEEAKDETPKASSKRRVRK